MAAREATCFERAGLLISAIKSRAAAEADGSARADAARFVELTFAVITAMQWQRSCRLRTLCGSGH